MAHRGRILHPLTQKERLYLEDVSRSSRETIGRIIRIRARVLLALDNGETCAEAARKSERSLSEADVYLLADRFNRIRLGALNYEVTSVTSGVPHHNLFSFGGFSSRLSRFFGELPRILRNRSHIFNQFRWRPRGRAQSRSGRQLAARFRGVSNTASWLRASFDRAFGMVRRACITGSEILVRQAQILRSFSNTKWGVAAIVLMIALLSFGAWRLSLPDPFDPGYVVLRPVSKPKEPNLSLEPVEVSPPPSQFASSIPEFIPVVRESEAPSDYSTVPVVLENSGDSTGTVVFISSQGAKKYSVSLEKGATKRFQLPSGTYQSDPPFDRENKTITLVPGAEYRFRIYLVYRRFGF